MAALLIILFPGLCFVGVSPLYGQCGEESCTWRGGCYTSEQTGGGQICVTTSCEVCFGLPCAFGGLGRQVGGNPNVQLASCSLSDQSLALRDFLTALRARNSGGVLISVPLQVDSPLQLISVKHDRKDFFSEGRVLNRSGRPVLAFRIGWLIADGSYGPLLSYGDWIRPPESLQAGSLAFVPSRGVRTRAFGARDATLVFFVSDVLFSEGDVWRARTEVSDNQAEEVRRTGL